MGGDEVLDIIKELPAIGESDVAAHPHLGSTGSKEYKTPFPLRKRWR